MEDRRKSTKYCCLGYYIAKSCAVVRCVIVVDAVVTPGGRRHSGWTRARSDTLLLMIR